MLKLPKTLRLNVDKKDIDDGRCGKPTQCMIAIAARRHLDGVTYSKVQSFGATIIRGGVNYKYALHTKGAKVIEHQDADDRPKEPFVVVLSQISANPVRHEKPLTTEERTVRNAQVRLSRTLREKRSGPDNRKSATMRMQAADKRAAIRASRQVTPPMTGAHPAGPPMGLIYAKEVQNHG